MKARVVTHERALELEVTNERGAWMCSVRLTPSEAIKLAGQLVRWAWRTRENKRRKY